MDQLRKLIGGIFVVLIMAAPVRAQIICHGCEPCVTATPSPTIAPTDTPVPTSTPTDTPTGQPTPTSTPTATVTPTAGALEQTNQFHYLGTFTLSQNSCSVSDCNCFLSGESIIAYRESTNTMFESPHINCAMGIGEFGPIPSTYTGQIVPAIHPRWGLAHVDPAEAYLFTGSNRAKIMGMYWDAPLNMLAVTFNMNYNVGAKDFKELLWISSTGDYTTQTQYGPYEVGSNNFIGGYIAKRWNTGHYYMGLQARDGTSSTFTNFGSYNIDVTGFPSATPAPGPNVTSHRWSNDICGSDTKELQHDSSCAKRGLNTDGAVQIPGTDTLVYWVSEAERISYGEGCVPNTDFGWTINETTGAQETWPGAPTNFETVYGFKPLFCAKGYHNDHFFPYLYLYDMKQMDEVEGHTRVASDVHPYGYVDLQALGMPTQVRAAGAAIDTVGKRIFLAISKVGNQATKIYVIGYD